MEKHHRLRRDPNWSPHGCNICGQEGHQAANCANGTVQWREKFGDDAFILREERVHCEEPEPDYEAMTVKARAYAQAKIAGDAAVTLGALIHTAQAEFAHCIPIAAPAPAAAPPAAAAPAGVPPKTFAGWTTYYDPMGRPYYHNSGTEQTLWEMPPEMRAAMP